MTVSEYLPNELEGMIKYRKSLGFSESTSYFELKPFVDFCVINYPLREVIEKDMIDNWFISHPYNNNNTRNSFVHSLRNLTNYLCFVGLKSYVPDEEYSVKHTKFIPYLFTAQELKSFFIAIDKYEATGWWKKLKPELVLPVYARMLYCCGMRPQEPAALRRDDIDFSSGDIYIRQSKRNKDRHIIMSKDMLKLCTAYDGLAGDREWFFQRENGTPYRVSWVCTNLRRIWIINGLGEKIPRPYDLRHAFASQNIINWIEAGKDYMQLIPYLSAYMGHSEIKNTLYYIHLLPDRLRETANIDWEKLTSIYGKEEIEDET